MNNANTNKNSDYGNYKNKYIKAGKNKKKIGKEVSKRLTLLTQK